MHNFVPNMVSFITTPGRKRWYGVGAYMLTKNLPTINWIRQALEYGQKEMGKLLVGALSACLANHRDQQE